MQFAVVSAKGGGRGACRGVLHDTARRDRFADVKDASVLRLVPHQVHRGQVEGAAQGGQAGGIRQVAGEEPGEFRVRVL